MICVSMAQIEHADWGQSVVYKPHVIISYHYYRLMLPGDRPLHGCITLVLKAPCNCSGASETTPATSISMKAPATGKSAVFGASGVSRTLCFMQLWLHGYLATEYEIAQCPVHKLCWCSVLSCMA
jgi:hypothetical protein